MTFTQWVNSVPPYVRKLHFMYEAIRTSGKCRWNIYRTSSKCRWSIYRTSRKRRGTLRIVHKVERSSPTVIHRRTISKEIPQASMTKISSKIIYLKIYFKSSRDQWDLLQGNEDLAHCHCYHWQKKIWVTYGLWQIFQYGTSIKFIYWTWFYLWCFQWKMDSQKFYKNAI